MGYYGNGSSRTHFPWCRFKNKVVFDLIQHQHNVLIDKEVFKGFWSQICFCNHRCHVQRHIFKNATQLINAGCQKTNSPFMIWESWSYDLEHFISLKHPNFYLWSIFFLAVLSTYLYILYFRRNYVRYEFAALYWTMARTPLIQRWRSLKDFYYFDTGTGYMWVLKFKRKIKYYLSK